MVEFPCLFRKLHRFYLSLYKLCLEAVAYACGVCIVGINVHLKSEILMHADLYVVEKASTLTAKLNVNVFVITDAERLTLFLTHVNVAVCDDTALGKGNHSTGTDNGHGSRARNSARLSDGGLDLKCKTVGTRNFNLRLLSLGTQNSYTLDGTHGGPNQS